MITRGGWTASLIVAILSQSLGASAWAESAADVLMQSVAPVPTPPGAKTIKPPVAANGPESDEAILSDNGTADEQFKLDDAFLTHLFSEWHVRRHALPDDVNHWVVLTLRHQPAQAAQAWNSIQHKVPGAFAHTAKAGWLYSLWRLSLAQPFFNEWSRAMTSSGYSGSESERTLEQVMAPGFDQWLISQSILLTPAQIEWVRSTEITRSPIFLGLHAYAALRSPKVAAQLLSHLPAAHPLKPILAETVMLSLARKEDLAATGRLLKAQLEPSVMAQKDPVLLGQYYLQVARLLYQADSLEASQTYYERIPNTSPSYLRAHEELAWVWLRQSNTQRLRGELVTLASPILRSKFVPEAYVVRAVSNLKLCYYDQVERDFTEFLQASQGWSNQIKAGLQTPASVRPEDPDFFMLMAERAVERRHAEVAALDQLAAASVTAIGGAAPQSHWLKLKDETVKDSDLALAHQTSEYRRFWTNRKTALVEAVRKMRFVKVELLSQWHEIAQAASNPDTQVLAVDGAGAQTDSIRVAQSAPKRALALQKTPEQIAFPYDGVTWPDELFRLRSLAPNQCLNRRTQ